MAYKHEQYDADDLDFAIDYARHFMTTLYYTDYTSEQFNDAYRSAVCVQHFGPSELSDEFYNYQDTLELTLLHNDEHERLNLLQNT